MRIRSVFAILCVLLLGVGIGLFAWSLQARSRAQSALSLAHSKADGAEASALRLQDRLAALGRERQRLAASQAPKPAAAPNMASLMASLSPQFLLSHPKLMNLVNEYLRSTLGQRYRTFYREMALTDDQIAKFEEIAAKRQTALLDLASGAAAKGISQADPSLAELRSQIQQQYSTDMLTLLGGNGMAQLTQFERMAVAVTLAQVAGSLAPDDEPLNSQQTEQLTQVIARSSPKYQQGGTLDPNSINWKSTLSAATSLLTEGQLQGLEAESEIFQLSRLIQRFQAKSK